VSARKPDRRTLAAEHQHPAILVKKWRFRADIQGFTYRLKEQPENKPKK
jgi:hypothetical protein